MSRRNRAVKRERIPDPVYNSYLVAETISKIMLKGLRSKAERIIYAMIDTLSEKTQKPGIEVFNEAINNIKPVMEVKSRRVGGANYQVPIEVRPERAQSLAIRWFITAARARKGKSMIERASAEVLDAFNNTGAAIKKKDDTHKMAEANKAFAHFRY
ncbi:MAG: 30S ribosomal protein S7 [Candidatus Margulisbacteria bacterium]|jgi:small subunit ribosomal protein S7|nr:30S ribosomal protein S7 [Candidatus Margulisiibacteriota bacterium]